MIIVFQIGYWCYIFLLLVNLILCSFKVKRERSDWAKILFVYLSGLFIIQVGSDIAGYITADNLYFSHIYLCFHFVVLGFFYHGIFRKHPKQQKFIRLYISFTSVYLFMQYLISPHVWFQFNLPEIILTNYLLIVCSLMYKYNTLSEKRSFFYLNVGVMSYSFLSSSLFLSGNILTRIDINIVIYIWAIHLMTILFLQIMIALQLTRIPSFNK